MAALPQTAVDLLHRQSRQLWAKSCRPLRRLASRRGVPQTTADRSGHNQTILQTRPSKTTVRRVNAPKRLGGRAVDCSVALA
jgi:hypothetical protein